ncbi:MAG: hypothetical protein V2B15_05540 [Bacteroidota bacterium]
MKTIHTIMTVAVLAAATALVSAQDYPDEYLGLPGDNLNLYAVMNLFQESETLEGFERSLNNEESRINNLDLNGDKLIDYITVSDYVEGNIHNIVLRAALDRNELQDVAVFVVEKLRNGEVQIQLIGDEALYGQNYIVEPIYAETPNPGYTGKVYRTNTQVVSTTYYDIAAWPVISYMYFPGYRVWRSSWYWGYYPSYWRPWRPYYWHYYYGYHYHWHDHYYSHYRHWDHYRCMAYNTYYRNHVRVFSPTVVVNVNKGYYRDTYSRPDQRRAGEELYTRTASRTGATGTRQSVERTATPSGTSRSGVTTNDRNSGAVRSTSTQRSTTPAAQVRSPQTRSSSSVSRSTSKSSTPAVRSTSKSSTPAVRSNSKSNAPAVRSSSKSSTPKRSQSVSGRSSAKPSGSSSRSGSSRSGSSKSNSGSQRSSSPSRR